MMKISKKPNPSYQNLYKLTILLTCIFFGKNTLSVGSAINEKENITVDETPINLNKLREIDDNENFLLEILELYITSTDDYIKKFFQEWENNDWEKAKDAVHDLKGNALTIYAVEMEKIFQNLEIAIREINRNKEKIQELMLSISPALNRVKEFIDQFQNSIKKS